MIHCCRSTPPSLRPPIVPASGLWLLGLGLLALLVPAVADAQCVLGVDGTTVTCEGTDPDGFDAGGVGSLDVDVMPDARVDNGGDPGVNALNLASDNNVDVWAGVEGESTDAEITASGAGSHGIAAENGNSIWNSGSIVVTGDDSIGIQVVNDNPLVYNEGAIAAGGDRSTGIQVGDGNAYVSNPGIITVTGDNGIGMDGGNGNGHGSLNSGVYSSGTIEADGASGIGIRFGDDNRMYISGTLSADGSNGVGIQVGDANTLNTFGSISADGSNGVGIRVGDANTVINSDTVSAVGSDGVGVLLGTAAGTMNEFRNYGTIAGGSGGGAAVSFAPSGPGSQNTLRNEPDGQIDGSLSGVAVRGSAGADTVRNLGTITGSVELGDGDDLFGLWTGGDIDGTVAGGSGSDMLTLRRSDAEGADEADDLDLSIFSDFEFLQIVEGGTWALSGSGSFSEANVLNGTLAPDGPLNLSGDYVQGTGTSLLIHLDPDGTSDVLGVGGNATIEPGASLELVTSGPLTEETTYTFLTTGGELSGLFAEVSLLGDVGSLRYFQVATPDSLAIEFSLGYASAAITGNQTATAIYLDEIVEAGPTGDMETVLQNLRGLPDPELRAAFDALHPEAYDAQASAMLSFGRSVAELAAFRRPRCGDVVYERRPEVVAPSPCSRGWMPWGSAFGLFADRNGSSGHIDFSNDGGGLLLGADHALGDHFMAYGFFGGGYTSVDIDEVGKGHLFSATLGAGGRWSLGGTRIDGLVGYARGWHEQEREIDFADISRTAKGDYSSNLIVALVKAGHTFRFGSLDLEPLATVEYGYLMQESFEESGAGAVDLEVDERSDSVLSTTAGARLAYTYFKWEYIEDWLEWADGVWTPEVSARWRGNWIGRDRELDARMVGAPAGVGSFTVEGQDAKQGLQVGAGVAFQPLRLRMSIRFDYDGFYGDGSTIHRIGASIRVPLGGSAG